MCTIGRICNRCTDFVLMTAYSANAKCRRVLVLLYVWFLSSYGVTTSSLSAPNSTLSTVLTFRNSKAALMDDYRVTEENFIDRMLDTVKDSETAVEGDTLRECDISSCRPTGTTIHSIQNLQFKSQSSTHSRSRQTLGLSVFEKQYHILS